MPAFKIAGLKGTTLDGAEELKEVADIVTKTPGGKGAAREFLEFILKSKNIWKEIVAKYS